jgi:molecular chaperone GrpE
MKHKSDKTKEPEDKDLQKMQREIEELREQIESLQQEKDDVFGKLQRVSADYANLEKRTAKQIVDRIAYEKETIIKTLLPVLDNFEHTFQKAHSGENTENVDAFVKGIRIIHDQMLDILKSHGVEQINALGEKFDPAMHEAIMQRAELQEPDNVVLEEFQKGYKLNSRVIRPSKVIVNKLPAEDAAEKQQESEEEKGEAGEQAGHQAEKAQSQNDENKNAE